MFSLPDKPEDKKFRLLPYFAVIFFIVLLLLGGSAFAYNKYYTNKIFPGVKINDSALSGKTLEEARQLVAEKTNKFQQDGLIITYGNQSMALVPNVPLPEGDFTEQLIIFDPNLTAEKAFYYGRSNGIIINFVNQLDALVFGKTIDADYKLNKEETIKILKENFKDSQISARNANLESSAANDGSIKFSVSDEKVGIAIDYENGMEEIENQLASLNFKPVSFLSKTEYPTIYKKDCLNVETAAEKITNRAPLILKNADKEWKIDKQELASWLSLEKSGDNIVIGPNKETITNYFNLNYASEINKEPKESRFAIVDGKVSEFQAGQDGFLIDNEATIEKINNDFIKGQMNTVEFVIKEVKSQTSLDETNDLGIKEIIGTGHSNFAGSPKNRRHNIQNGAQSLAGILIKPNQEFSLGEALGDVNGSTGYLQEMVIKGDKTIPEYGGGLCQIATTIFRAAMASGFPITERRNHSYRVRYYEPAGMDAAIYSPHPDVKFINDSSNNVLIQYRLDGDNLYFDFWGTKDGRTSSTTKPVVYNLVKPAPTKLIETLDLPVGKKKCTESAHTGADTYFNYIVNYPNGEINEKRFSSHYVPWQEVCLIGVEKLSVPNATSTPSTATSTSTTVLSVTTSSQIATSTN
jgi:vancomycin resistance protein YoaR